MWRAAAIFSSPATVRDIAIASVAGTQGGADKQKLEACQTVVIEIKSLHGSCKFSRVLTLISGLMDFGRTGPVR
jgi:hypothetical protein